MRRSITLALALVVVVSGLAAATTGAVAHDAAVSNDTDVTAHDYDDDRDTDSERDASERRGSDDGAADGDAELDRENGSVHADEGAREHVDGRETVVPPADPPVVGAGVPCWKLWPQVDMGDPCIPYAYPRPLG